jgi:hypothetical protein
MEQIDVREFDIEVVDDYWPISTGKGHRDDRQLQNG